MKFIFASLLLMSNFAISQVIDPTGNDDWKTLQVTLTTPHKKTFPTYSSCSESFRIQFWDEYDYLYPSKVTKSQSQTKQIQIPAAKSGNFYVRYELGNDYIRVADGNVENGLKKITVQFNRIDVNDMLVTREDRTTYMAPGRATISYFDKNGTKRVVCSSMPTKKGINVLPGYKYHIRVGANTEDGYDTYEATLDYR